MNPAKTTNYWDVTTGHINGHHTYKTPDFTAKSLKDFVNDCQNGTEELCESLSRLEIGCNKDELLANTIKMRLADHIRGNLKNEPEQLARFIFQSCFHLPASLQDTVWQGLAFQFPIHPDTLQNRADQIIATLLICKKMPFSTLHALVATLAMASYDVSEKGLILFNQYQIPYSFQHPLFLANNWLKHSLEPYESELRELHLLVPIRSNFSADTILKTDYKELPPEQKVLDRAVHDLLSHTHPCAIYLGFRLQFLDNHVRTSIPFIDPKKQFSRFHLLFPLFAHEEKDQLVSCIDALSAYLPPFREVLSQFKGLVQQGKIPLFAYIRALTSTRNETVRSAAWHLWKGYAPACFKRQRDEWLELGVKVYEGILPEDCKEALTWLDCQIQRDKLSFNEALGLLVKVIWQCQTEESQQLFVKIFLELFKAPSSRLADLSFVNGSLPQLLSIFSSSPAKVLKRAVPLLLDLFQRGVSGEMVVEACVKIVEEDFYSAFRLWQRAESLYQWRTKSANAPDVKLLEQMARKIPERSTVELFSWAETFLGWLELLEGRLSEDECFMLRSHVHELYLFKTAVQNETPAYWKQFVTGKACPPEYASVLLLELFVIALKKKNVQEATEWIDLLKQRDVPAEHIEPYQMPLEEAIDTFIEQRAFNEALGLLHWCPCLFAREGKRDLLIANLHQAQNAPLEWVNHLLRASALLDNEAFIASVRAYATSALLAVMPQMKLEYLGRILLLFKVFRIHSGICWQALLQRIQTKDHQVLFLKRLQADFKPQELFTDDPVISCQLWTEIIRLCRQHPKEVSEIFLSQVPGTKAAFGQASAEAISTYQMQLCLTLLKKPDRSYRPIFLTTIMQLEAEMGPNNHLTEERKELCVGFVTAAVDCKEAEIIAHAYDHLRQILATKEQRRIEQVLAAIPLLIKRHAPPLSAHVKQAEIPKLDYWACAEANLSVQQIPEACEFFALGLRRNLTTVRAFQLNMQQNRRHIEAITARFLACNTALYSFEMLSALFEKTAETFIERKSLQHLREALFIGSMSGQALPYYVKFLKTLPKEEPTNHAAQTAAMMSAAQTQRVDFKLGHFCMDLAQDLHARLQYALATLSKEQQMHQTSCYKGFLNLMLWIAERQNLEMHADAADTWRMAVTFLEQFFRFPEVTSQDKLDLLWRFAFRLLPARHGISQDLHFSRIQALLSSISHPRVQALQLLCNTGNTQDPELLLQVSDELIQTGTPSAILRLLTLVADNRKLLTLLPAARLAPFFTRFYTLATQQGPDLASSILQFCGEWIIGDPQASLLGTSLAEGHADGRRYVQEYLISVCTFVHARPAQATTLLRASIRLLESAYGAQFYSNHPTEWLANVRALFAAVAPQQSAALYAETFSIVQILVMNKQNQAEDALRTKQLISDWLHSSLPLANATPHERDLFAMVAVEFKDSLDKSLDSALIQFLQLFLGE